MASSDDQTSEEFHPKKMKMESQSNNRSSSYPDLASDESNTKEVGIQEVNGCHEDYCKIQTKHKQDLDHNSSTSDSEANAREDEVDSGRSDSDNQPNVIEDVVDSEAETVVNEEDLEEEIDNDDDITSERDIQTPTNEDRGCNYSDCEAESVGNEEEKVDIISTPPEEQNQAGVNDEDQESDIGKRPTKTLIQIA